MDEFIKNLPEEDYNLFLTATLAEIICEDVPKKIKELHFNAYMQLTSYLDCYKKSNYSEKLLCRIAKKKGQMLLKAKTKAEISKIIEPRVPDYNGREFIEDEYNIPEEELICWSEASLNCALNSIAYKRYAQVFREVFPDDAERYLQNKNLIKTGV